MKGAEAVGWHMLRRMHIEDKGRGWVRRSFNQAGEHRLERTGTWRKGKGGTGSDRNDRGRLQMTRPRILVEPCWKLAEVRHGLRIPGVAPSVVLPEPILQDAQVSAMALKPPLASCTQTPNQKLTSPGPGRS